MSILLLGLLAGLDNFVVSAGYGAVRPNKPRILVWIACVAAAEATAPIIGFHLAGAASLGSELGGPLLVMMGALVALGAWKGHALGGLSPVLAPIALSVDNLVAGAGLGASGEFTIGSAAMAGALAAIVGIAGLLMGRIAVPRLRVAPQALFATCLIGVGLMEMAG